MKNKEIEVCDFRYDEGLRSRVEKQILPTLTTHSGMNGPMSKESATVLKKEGLRIRKLSPKECWRLMGFEDEDFNKAKQVNSDNQLYKQAGNSIVVQVLEAIFKELL